MIDRRLGLLACAFVLLVAGPGLRAHGAESVTWNDDEIDAGLDELEKLAAAGRTDAAKVAHIKTSIMRSMINGPDGGTMRLLWQQIRFDELVGKQVLGGSFITDHVTKTLENGGGMVAMGGGVAAIDKFGTAYSYHGRGTILRSEDVVRRTGELMIHLHRNGRFVPWRLVYVDLFGNTRDIFEYDAGRWRKRYAQKAVRFAAGSEEIAQYVFDPVSLSTPRVVALSDEGHLFAVTLDEQGQLVKAQSIDPKATRYPEMIGSGASASIRLDGDSPQSLAPGEPCQVIASFGDADRESVKGALVKAGMPEEPASIISQRVLKTGDHVVRVGATLFRGDPKQMRRGKYEALGHNSWNMGGSIAYLASFEKDRLVRLSTGDEGIYDQFEKSRFRMTLSLSSPQRSYVGIYGSDGKVVHGALFMNDLGAQLQLDGQLRLHEAGLRGLIQTSAQRSREKDAKRSGVQHHFSGIFLRTPTLVDELFNGFWLKGEPDGEAQFYTLSGLPVASLSSARPQVVVSFVQAFQRRNYAIARIGTLSPERLLVDWPVERDAAVLHTDEKGELVCEFTRSTIFATVLRTWTERYAPSR